MQEIIAMAIKDLKHLVRDKGGFFFTFFFPIIVAVFFGTVFSGSSGKTQSISVIIVDEDGTEESAEFVAELQQAAELETTPASREEAVEKVRLGKAGAYIAIKPGFGQRRKSIFWGEPPEVELGVDPSRQATAGMLQGILMKYGVRGFQKTFTNPGLMRGSIGPALESAKASTNLEGAEKNHLVNFLSELDAFMAIQEEEVELMREMKAAAGSDAESETEEKDGGYAGFQPLKITKSDVARKRIGPTSGYAVSFPQGVMWGIIGCGAGFGISIVVERTRGTLMRLRSAPITMTHILAGKALACFVTTLGISVGLILIGVSFFGLQIHSLGLLVMAMVSNCLCFVGVMMLLSVLGKTEQSAGGIGWAILLMMSMIGGGMIPLFILPAWMRTLSHISPVKWGILAMEGAMWRHFTFAELLPACAILVAVGVLAFSIGAWAFRMSYQ